MYFSTHFLRKGSSKKVSGEFKRRHRSLLESITEKEFLQKVIFILTYMKAIWGLKRKLKWDRKSHEISQTQQLCAIFLPHIRSASHPPTVTPERAPRRSACVCKLRIWPSTKTLYQGFNGLFSGEIWCRQRVNSSIRRLVRLVCPNAPMGKESPIH